MTVTGPITPCPDCGSLSSENYGGTGRCWECHNGIVNGTGDLFKPNGRETCPGCGARLTYFGGRLICVGCTSRASEMVDGEPSEALPAANAPRNLATGKLAAGRFTTRKLDANEFRPVEFAWMQRLVMGVLNVLAGTEGIGKGTLLAWVIAQLTRGGLPGALRGKPARVLWLGDEDSWTHVVGPRLHAAGADLSLVEEMVADDGRLFNVHADAGELDRIITAGRFDVVVFEALLDHMPAGRNGDPTQHVRVSLAPTRAVLRRRGTTALATMHTRKGPSSSFRDLMAGSHQYNALSRSSLLLAVHPNDEDRRIIVAGKQNYSRAAMTESFSLVEHGFELNDHRFSVSLAKDFRVEPEISIDSLLATSRGEAREDLGEQLRQVLSSEPRKLSNLARAVGRAPTDGTVRRALEALEATGHAEKVGRGLWQRKPIGLIEGSGSAHGPGVA